MAGSTAAPRPAPAPHARPSSGAPSASAPISGWVLEALPDGTSGAPLGAPVRVFGLTPAERLRRSLGRAGLARVEVLSADAEPPHAVSGRHLVVRGDCIVDERLVAALRDTPGALLVARPPNGVADLAVAANVDAGAVAQTVEALRRGRRPATALRAHRPEQLVPGWNPALRKRDAPLVLRPRAGDVRASEALVFAAAYKGLTDLVTARIWPLPARAVTRWCARRGVSPNAITALSWALAALVTVLFAVGELGWGLAAAWLMTFLDTVDGKLARVTLTSSRVGHVLDHGLDLTHPPVWWAAFAVGLVATGALSETAAWWGAGIVVGGYLVGRALEGIFIAAFGFEIFCWERFDGVFRAVIARRNPNLLLLTAGTAAGRPELGYAAVAGWTLVSNATHVVRLLQARGRRRRGERVRPWNADAP